MNKQNNASFRQNTVARDPKKKQKWHDKKSSKRNHLGIRPPKINPKKSRCGNRNFKFLRNCLFLSPLRTSIDLP